MDVSALPPLVRHGAAILLVYGVLAAVSRSRVGAWLQARFPEPDATHFDDVPQWQRHGLGVLVITAWYGWVLVGHTWLLARLDRALEGGPLSLLWFALELLLALGIALPMAYALVAKKPAYEAFYEFAQQNRRDDS